MVTKCTCCPDANYQVPLVYEMTAGNVNDSPLLPGLLQKGRDMFDWLRPRYLLADRGYDSSANNYEVVRQEAVPIIHKRKPTAEGRTARRGLHERRCPNLYEQ